MANVLSQVNIIDGQIVESHHISQSINAFTGVAAYDISLSGSFNMTGSINGQPLIINPLTASYAIQAIYSFNAPLCFPYTGEATINGSLGVTGSSVFEGPIAGLFNTAIGNSTLSSIALGEYNIAIGYRGLAYNTLGYNNISIGTENLNYNVDGYNNIAIGSNILSTELFNLSNNIAIGDTVGNNVTGDNNIAIGSFIDFNLFEATALGHEITIGTGNELHIGSATNHVGTLIGTPPTSWQVYINETLVNFELV